MVLYYFPYYSETLSELLGIVSDDIFTPSLNNSEISSNLLGHAFTFVLHGALIVYPLVYSLLTDAVLISLVREKSVFLLISK